MIRHRHFSKAIASLLLTSAIAVSAVIPSITAEAQGVAISPEFTVTSYDHGKGVVELTRSEFGDTYASWMDYLIFSSGFKALPGAKFPFPNSNGYSGGYISDGNFAINNIHSSAGCMKYSCFASAITYGDNGYNAGIGLSMEHTMCRSNNPTTVRDYITKNVWPGEQIRINNRHSMTMVAYEYSSNAYRNGGIYALEYPGDNSPCIRLVYYSFDRLAKLAGAYGIFFYRMGDAVPFNGPGASAQNVNTAANVEPSGGLLLYKCISTSNIGRTSARLNAAVVPEGPGVYEVGVEISRSGIMAEGVTTMNDSNYPKIVNKAWYDPNWLSPGTKYYYRFYYKATPNDTRHYSIIDWFFTKN